MILFNTGTALHKWLDNQRKETKDIGFVPTMGALHAGHISLIKASQKNNGCTVCSLFVNPAQFTDTDDFEKYPKSLEKDVSLLKETGCDALFTPSVKEMYPVGLSSKEHYNLGYLETILEGKYRPGHFQGVCMAVHRLLEIVQPGNLYLGQKDYQQCMVLTRLIELIDQDEKIKINICPTLREKDGLAMSSRNMRLNAGEREKASCIYQSLQLIKENLQKGSLDELKENAAATLAATGFKVDYVEIADAGNLSLLSDWNGEQKLVALIAATISKIRLIDNLLLN